MHETKDGKIITVGENGEISKIEDASDAEAVEVDAEEEKEEVKMEEKEDKKEMEEEDKEEKKFDSEALVEAIAEMLLPQAEIIEELKKEVVDLSTRLEKMAAEPGAPKVNTNTFKEQVASKEAKLAARLDVLKGLRK
jgi:hypothetical protein